MDWQIAVLIGLILFSGFFSAAEIALFTLPQATIRSLVEQNTRNAHLLARLRAQPQRVLIMILVGNNFLNIAGSSLATVVAIEKLGSAGAGVATGVMTFLTLYFSEIIPKTLAQRYAAAIAPRIAPFLRFLMVVLWPAVWVMDMLVTAFQRTVRIPEANFGVTEEEVRAMMNIGHESGSFEKDEKEMIERVFLLNDITAEDVMTPAEYFVSFDIDTTLRDALPVIMESGYSRFPVEKTDSSAVEGIIYTKDVFGFLAQHEIGLEEATEPQAGDAVLDTRVAALMKPPVFVPSTARIDDLLKEFQKHHKHIAIVVDAHGSILGLVSLEDLLEEIVGEIIDESDVDEATIRRVDKETIEIDPRITIGKVNTFFNSRLKGSRQKTVGWLVLKNFGRIPEKGDSITIDDYNFIVEEADERRIKRLLMIRTAKARAAAKAPKTK